MSLMNIIVRRDLQLFTFMTRRYIFHSCLVVWICFKFKPIF